MEVEDEVFRLHEDLKDGKYEHWQYESFTSAIRNGGISTNRRFEIGGSSCHRSRNRTLVLSAVYLRFLVLQKRKGDAWSSWAFSKIRLDIIAQRHKNRLGIEVGYQEVFDNVDQEVLFEILSRTVADKMTMALLRNILKSFPKGIPLGNLTSQLFANVCLNEAGSIRET